MNKKRSMVQKNMWIEEGIFHTPKFFFPKFVGEDDKGGGGSGDDKGKPPVVAPTFSREEISKMVAEESGKIVSAAMDKLMKDLPGMTKRQAAEISKELVNSSMEEFKKTQTVQQADQSRVKALEDELAVMRETGARKEKTNLILSKASAYKILKSARDWVVTDIAEKVKLNDKGEYVMVIKEKLAETNKLVDKEVDIEEGIKYYFENHTDLLIADVQGGAGARNNGNQQGSSATSYQQLLDNPPMMNDYVKNKPDELTRMRAEYDKERKK